MCIKGIHLLCNRNSYGTVHCSQTLSPLITREMCLSAVADTVKEARYQAQERAIARSGHGYSPRASRLSDSFGRSDTECLCNSGETTTRPSPCRPGFDGYFRFATPLQWRCSSVAIAINQANGCETVGPELSFSLRNCFVKSV